MLKIEAYGAWARHSRSFNAPALLALASSGTGTPLFQRITALSPVRGHNAVESSVHSCR